MTSVRLKPMLFTSIWTSSAPGGGTSRFSIFSTLASPYSWKRTMRAMISSLLFCDLRSHQTMPQIHSLSSASGGTAGHRPFSTYLISCLLFGPKTHASTTQSDPLLLPTRNGPCREDGALHWEYLSYRVQHPPPSSSRSLNSLCLLCGAFTLSKLVLFVIGSPAQFRNRFRSLSNVNRSGSQNASKNAAAAAEKTE